MRPIPARLVAVVALLAFVLPLPYPHHSVKAVATPNPGLIKDVQTIRHEMFPFIAQNLSSTPIDSVAILGNNVLFAANDPLVGNELFISDGTNAGTRMLKDIYGGATGSFPTSLRTFGNYVYFAAATAASGIEIWRTDGTEAGTKMVSDYSAGTTSTTPRYLTGTGNALYFQCTTSSAGVEMCKMTYDAVSDTETISLLKDIAPGTGSAQVGRPNVVGNNIFFYAADGTNGNELWVSDGTSAGTTMLKDINTGDNSVSNYPLSITKFDTNRVVFWGYSAATGYEPWVSDGTTAGTFQLGEINASTAASYNMSYPFFSVFNGVAYFFAHNGTSIEMWKTDGTSVGTVMTSDPVAGANMHNGGGRLWEFNNKLYYYGLCTISAGVELCSYDPATNTFTLVKDINVGAGNGGSIEVPGSVVSLSTPAVVVGSKFYFPGNMLGHGTELWQSDGTTAGTSELKDINNTPNGPNTKDAAVKSLIPFRGGFLFAASTNGNASNFQPYFSDGTVAGTTSLEPSNNGTAGQAVLTSDIVTNAITVDQYTYFIGESSQGQYGLVRTDGTVAGTSNAITINPYGYITGAGFGLAKVGRYILMTASSGSGNEMFTYNVDTGVTAFKDIYAGTASGNPFAFYPFANGTKALFYANNGSTGNELWTTDGTINGTSFVKDINSGSAAALGSFPGFYELNGYVYFWATTAAEGIELWRSDGTAAGTELFSVFNPGVANGGATSGQGSLMASVGNDLVVCAVDGTNGSELYKVDTTASANTANFTLVKDVYAGANGGCRGGLTTFGSKVVFMGLDATNGSEMWVSDLTNAGTTMLFDAFPGNSSGLSLGNNFGDRNFRMPIINGVGYFIANETASNPYLWRTDGTTAGTSKVSSAVRPLVSTSYGMRVVGDKLYFSSGSSETSGSEPWVSDGTSSGTFMLGDLNIGSYSSSPFQWGQLANGKVFFMAKGTWVGYEPFMYDPALPADGVASAVAAPPLETATTTTTTITTTTTNTVASTTTLAPSTTVAVQPQASTTSSTSTSSTTTSTVPVIPQAVVATTVPITTTSVAPKTTTTSTTSSVVPTTNVPTTSVPPESTTGESSGPSVWIVWTVSVTAVLIAAGWFFFAAKRRRR